MLLQGDFEELEGEPRTEDRNDVLIYNVQVIAMVLAGQMLRVAVLRLCGEKQRGKRAKCHSRIPRTPLSRTISARSFTHVDTGLR